jgi:ribosome assembly protein YihI (activator of Der GTPase)
VYRFLGSGNENVAAVLMLNCHTKKKPDILSPIETPADIVRRPTLRRILKSPQMELLANTSMEFIESEKTFNKILSRLSSILYCDDPQYVDVTYDRETEAQNGEFSMDVDAKSDDKGHKSSPESAHAGRNGYKGDAVADEEAQLILVRVRELLQVRNMIMTVLCADGLFITCFLCLQENINFSNEYLNRLRSARAKLTRTNTQKKQLWKRLKMKAIEQERKRIQHMQQQAQRETNGAASVLSSLARNTSPGPSGLNLSYT